MLELYSSHRYASRQSRREFLQAGMLGISGLTLAQLLRAEAAAGIKSSRKSVINIHLDGATLTRCWNHRLLFRNHLMPSRTTPLRIFDNR